MAKLKTLSDFTSYDVGNFVHATLRVRILQLINARRPRVDASRLIHALYIIPIVESYARINIKGKRLNDISI